MKARRLGSRTLALPSALKFEACPKYWAPGGCRTVHLQTLMANANKVHEFDDWLNRAWGTVPRFKRLLVQCVKWAHPYYEFNGVGLFSLTWSSAREPAAVVGRSPAVPHGVIEGTGKKTSNSETGRNDPTRRFTMPSLIPQLMLPHFRSRDVRTSRRPRRVLPMWHSERGYAACVEIARAGTAHINRFS